MRFVITAIAAALVSLVGCTAPAVRPAADMVYDGPAQWSSPIPHGGQLTELKNWWAQFDDPLLLDLIEGAQLASPSMGQATARISQARAGARIERSSNSARVKASADASKASGSDVSRNAYLDASWELDLLGKKQLIEGAATSRLAAATAAWHGARVSLAAEVASRYFDYRYCEESVEVAKAALGSRRKTLDLVRLKVKAGATAEAQLHQVEAGVAEASNSVIQEQGSCTQLVHQLTQLTGLHAKDLREALTNGSRSKGIPSPTLLSFQTLPADLIRQRPDVAEAEQLVLAAAADAGVAQAERYPSVSLLGSLSWSGSVGERGATSWSWGPRVSLPLLDGGRAKFSAQKAVAVYEEALFDWRKQVLSAVYEVEDSLTRLQVAHAQVTSADLALERYEDVFRSTEVRYNVGAASLLELEDARRSALSAKQSRQELNLEHAKARVSLYKAAGGGWPVLD